MNTLLARNNTFVKAISGQPYYRIFALSDKYNQKNIQTEDQHIRDILHNPPNKRWAGFGVTGLLEREESRSREGISGPNVTGGHITLLNNGYFEVICPINIQFQRGWGDSQFGIPDDVKWLYPYVVIEFPVSFIRLVKDIYDASGIVSDVSIEQWYYNISGYVLPEGPPTFPTFGAFIEERGTYKKDKPINYNICVSAEDWVSDNFVPDRVAYDLVRNVYAEFGISNARAIPAFDEQGRFILK